MCRQSKGHAHAFRALLIHRSMPLLSTTATETSGNRATKKGWRYFEWSAASSLVVRVRFLPQEALSKLLYTPALWRRCILFFSPWLSTVASPRNPRGNASAESKALLELSHMGCGASSPAPTTAPTTAPPRLMVGDVVCSRADRTRTGTVEECDGSSNPYRVRWDDTGHLSN